MRKSFKIAGGIAVAGVLAAGSYAFTATGLATNTDPAVFLGGTISQTVSGATLDSIAYGYADGPADTKVSLVTLTFTDNSADGHTVSVVLDNGVTPTGTITCTSTNVITHVSTCDLSGQSGGGYTGTNNVAVTVAP